MTSVEICNVALAKLGANQITDFTDGSTEATLCQAQYPLLLRAVLEARAWTFNTKRLLLTSGIPPDPIPAGWGFAFQVPNDCIRVINLYVPNPQAALVQWVNTQIDATYTPISWERLQNFCYTNSGPQVWCKYNIQVDDPDKYSPAFIEALATRIAMELSIPITNNASYLDAYTKLYAAKLQDASSTEGQQGTTQILQGRYLAARRL